MGVNESMHFELDVFGNFFTYLLFIVNYIDMKIFCTVDSQTNALQQSKYLFETLVIVFRVGLDVKSDLTVLYLMFVI